MPTSALSRIDARADVGIGPYDGMFSTNPNFSPLVKLFLIMIADCPEYVI